MNRLRSNPWVTLLVLCIGFFMILLDVTIVNIAIPSMMEGLNAPLDSILWVLNGYVMVFAVLLITAGRLGDIYGPRNLFAAGLVVFTLASAACGLSHDTTQMIVARAVQGVGGALLMPQTLTILTTIFPPERRGAAFGVWGAVAGIATIAGPTLGGLIVTYFSWHWIFYMNVPLGILALAATFLVIPDLRPGRRHRLDLVGILLASLGLLGIVFGLIEGERFEWGVIWGWVTVPGVIVAGVVILLLFIVWERMQDEPLIPLAIFGNRNYLVMNWIGITISFTMMGLFLPLTIYLQSVLGMTALAAGLTMAPMPASSMLISPWAGRLADKTGGKYVLAAGLLLFGIGSGLIAYLAQIDSAWTTFLLPGIVAGVGQGLTFAPMTTIAMRHIEPRIAGAASGVLTTTRQVGMVVGGAMMGAILQTQLSSSLHAQAVAHAAQLPAQAREPFIDGFSKAVKSGMEFGATQSGGFPQIPDLSPQALEQLRGLGHLVFMNGFVDAMKPTIFVTVILLLVGALSCLAAEGRREATERARAGQVFPDEA